MFGLEYKPKALNVRITFQTKSFEQYPHLSFTQMDVRFYGWILYVSLVYQRLNLLRMAFTRAWSSIDLPSGHHAIQRQQRWHTRQWKKWSNRRWNRWRQSRCDVWWIAARLNYDMYKPQPGYSSCLPILVDVSDAASWNYSRLSYKPLTALTWSGPVRKHYMRVLWVNDNYNLLLLRQAKLNNEITSYSSSTALLPFSYFPALVCKLAVCRSGMAAMVCVHLPWAPHIRSVSCGQ